MWRRSLRGPISLLPLIWVNVNGGNSNAEISHVQTPQRGYTRTHTLLLSLKSALPCTQIPLKFAGYHEHFFSFSPPCRLFETLAIVTQTSSLSIGVKLGGSQVKGVKHGKSSYIATLGNDVYSLSPFGSFITAAAAAVARGAAQELLYYTAQQISIQHHIYPKY